MRARGLLGGLFLTAASAFADTPAAEPPAANAPFLADLNGPATIVSDAGYRVLDWNVAGGPRPVFRLRQLRLVLKAPGPASVATRVRDLTLVETREGRRWVLEHVTQPPGTALAERPFERVASSAGGVAELWFVPDPGGSEGPRGLAQRARRPGATVPPEDPLQASRQANSGDRSCGGAWLRLRAGGRDLRLDGGELARTSVLRLVGRLRSSAFRPEELEDLFRLLRMERYPETAGVDDAFVLPRLLLRDRLPMSADARSLYREPDDGTPLDLGAFGFLVGVASPPPLVSRDARDETPPRRLERSAEAGVSTAASTATSTAASTGCRVAREGPRALGRMARRRTTSSGRITETLLLGTGSDVLSLSAVRAERDPMRLAERTFRVRLGAGAELVFRRSVLEGETVAVDGGAELKMPTGELTLRTVRCHLRSLVDGADGRLLAALEEARRLLSAPGSGAGEEVEALDLLSLPAPPPGSAVTWEEAPPADCELLMAER